MSKNYGLKILVRVRVYARVYDCQDNTKEENTHQRNTTTGKRATTSNTKRPEYICIFAGTGKV